MASTRRLAAPWVEPLVWLVALAIVAAALVAGGYRTSDPDSALHIEIESDLSRMPARAWIAPEWNGNWEIQGLYREHPVGTFVPPVLLILAGYPAAQAGFLANAIYQALTLFLLIRLAGLFLERQQARALVWLLLFLPIALAYQIRANHEQPLLFFTLLALYGTLQARTGARWIMVPVVGVVGAVLVKGVVAAAVPPACALALALDRRPMNARRMKAPVRAWLSLALAVLAGVFVAFGYEQFYRSVTGQSFITDYGQRQLGLAAAHASAWLVPQKLYNLAWYLGRLAWFAAPWTVVLVVEAWRARKSNRQGANEGLVLALGIAALWIGLFSLSDRRADRYIFPAYFLVGSAGAAWALARYPTLRSVTARIQRIQPFEIVATWLALSLAHLATTAAGILPLS